MDEERISQIWSEQWCLLGQVWWLSVIFAKSCRKSFVRLVKEISGYQYKFLDVTDVAELRQTKSGRICWNKALPYHKTPCRMVSATPPLLAWTVRDCWRTSGLRTRWKPGKISSGLSIFTTVEFRWIRGTRMLPIWDSWKTSPSCGWITGLIMSWLPSMPRMSPKYMRSSTSARRTASNMSLRLSCRILFLVTQSEISFLT